MSKHKTSISLALVAERVLMTKKHEDVECVDINGEPVEEKYRVTNTKAAKIMHAVKLLSGPGRIALDAASIEAQESIVEALTEI